MIKEKQKSVKSQGNFYFLMSYNHEMSVSLILFI